MSLHFSISDWAAWGPGLASRSDWLSWLAAPAAVSSGAVAAVPELAPMLRRRVDPVGRAALQVAYWLAPSPTPDYPLVFASRWGDIARSVALMGEMARGDGISPAGFSTSVHNAIGALFSIARGDQTSYTAVAGGEATAEAGVTEALGLLADGARAVTLVVYEDALPIPFDGFTPTGDFVHAWACRLVAASGAGLSLDCQASEGAAARRSDDGDALPPDLAALRFLVGNALEWKRTQGARTWHWRRHV